MHLDPADPAGLQRWLSDRGLLADTERVHALVRAGEGNMNLVLRAGVGQRTLIVKQARPWVEKYPQVAAPPERAEVEAAFYDAIADIPVVASRMPRLLHHDADDHVLVLEDLGAASDCSDAYAGRRLAAAELDELLDYLDTLHAVRLDAAPPILANRAMRALNHEHVFDLPFRPDNGLDLDAICPGLSDVAARVRREETLLRRVADLGQRYLSDGAALLHGDFYPGSWVRSTAGLRVLDPEFACLGDPAWDRGVLVAHLVLTDHPTFHVLRALDDAPDRTLGFAGVEVLRRLLGVAQLPLQASVHRRAAWAETALEWLAEDA